MRQLQRWININRVQHCQVYTSKFPLFWLVFCIHMDCKIKPDMCDFLQSSVYESAFRWHPTLWKMLHLDSAWHQMWASSMPDFRRLSQLLLPAQLKYPLAMSSNGPFSQMEGLEMLYLGKFYRKYLLHGESRSAQTYTSIETFEPKKKKESTSQRFTGYSVEISLKWTKSSPSQTWFFTWKKKKNKKPVTSSSLHDVTISFLPHLPHVSPSIDSIFSLLPFLH